jgi:hypothetical protein
VLVPATVETCEDVIAELPGFRAIREKHGVAVPPDQPGHHGIMRSNVKIGLVGPDPGMDVGRAVRAAPGIDVDTAALASALHAAD